MSEAKQLMNNTGFSFITHSVRIGTNLFIFIFLARVLGVGDFGKFTFSITFATLFLYFADFGLDRVAVIKISRDKDLINIYFSNVIIVKAFLSLATFLLAWLIINLMKYPGGTKLLVYILSISVIIFSYTSILNAIFRGIEKLKYETTVTFVNNISLIVSISGSIALGFGVMAVGISFLVSRLIGFLFALGVLKYKVGKLVLHFDLNFCKKMLKMAAPFAFVAGVGSVFQDIDTVLLSYLKGDQAVGYYQAAMRIIAALAVIPLILDGSFFPLFSRLYNQNKSLENVGKQLMTTLTYIAVPLAVGLFTLTENIITFVYGESFRDSILALQILSFVIFLKFFIRGFQIILLATGKQSTVFCVIFFATVMNIAFNLYLIPKYGMMGCVNVAVLTHAFILSSYAYLIKKSRKAIMIDKNIALILLLGILPGILIHKIRSLHLIPLIIIYTICYLSSTFFFLKKERAYIFEAVRFFGKN